MSPLRDCSSVRRLAAWFGVLAVLLWLGQGVPVRAQSGTVTVNAASPGVAIPSTLYGAFFEEINRAGDGGLYGEMIQNRSFEDDPNKPIGWTLIKSANTTITATLDTTTATLNANNPTSLKLAITKTTGGRVGVYSQGFKGTAMTFGTTSTSAYTTWESNFATAAASSVDGLTITAGSVYDLTLYARAASFAGPLTATLEKTDGTVLATGSVATVGSAWTKYSVTFTATGSDTNARLVLATTKTGTLWLDMVSLFPRNTFNNRANGLRPDIAQAIADMHPGFLRFPGGTVVNGYTLADAERWKNTIGDVAQRPGHWDIWGYRTTNGLGFHEFLQFCEDIGATPLFVINCGMTDQREFVDVASMGPWVQDAVDAIQYANGDATTTYGAMRAAAGHPAPFNLRYIEIGNENGQNWGGSTGTADEYNSRYVLFYNAIKAAYPGVTVITNTPAISGPQDMVDEHYYNTTDWFQANATRYDSYSRTGPKIFVGELAVTTGAGNGNLGAALGEAAFMTGMERNADVVNLGSYAPLCSNPPWKSWTPNAINFNSNMWYGTPSYHTQKLFASNTGTMVLPSTSDFSSKYGGSIGLSTWNTQSEYRNVVVTDANSNVLYQSDFANAGATNWTASTGTWSLDTANAAYQQTANGTDYRSTFGGAGSTAWSNYTLNLQARKVSGNEGFLVMFYVGDANNWIWWNVGGWTNTLHGVERCVGGTKTTIATVSGSVNTNQWYNVTINVSGSTVNCYLDGVLKQTVTLPSPVFAAASLKESTREILLKAVNTSATAQATSIVLNGVSAVASTAQQTVLTSASLTDENSFTTPTKIVPVVNTLSTPATQFPVTLAPYSITVLRLQAAPAATTQSISVAPGNGQVTLSWASVPGAASYTIQRSTSASGPFYAIASGITTTQYTDKGVINGMPYYYIVQAVNSAGVSATPTSASVKPYIPITTQELAAPKLAVSSGGGATVTIPSSVYGRVYQLQSTVDLAGGVWQNIGAVQSGTGADVTLTDPTAPTGISQRFWRVQLSP